jgi:thiosulfate/3-mercaptopyruvate sulfurtransferase
MFQNDFRSKLLAGVVSAVAMTALTGAMSAAIVPAAQAQAATLPIIVSASQAKELIAGGAKLVDVRSRAAYDKGHIPGAVNLPWQTLNVSESDGIRNEFASDETFEKALGAAGLSYGDTILIYDTNALPGRAYVAFEYAGLGARTHVLDGGIGAWKDSLSTEAVTAAATDFKLTGKNDIRVDKAYVASKVGQEGAVIIDGRNEEAYSDGHIPGAKALPAAGLLNKDATLQSEPLLTALLQSKGVTQDQEVVSYCGSGVAAANNYLALKNLGYANVVLYDASWDEWSRDPRAGQQVSLANYTFTGAPVDAAADVPQFLDEAKLKALAQDPKVVVVDVRSPSDYAAGHIPGSVNVYWDSTFDKDRVLLPADQLKEIYAKAGVTPDKRVILFTRGGLQLSHSYTVLNLLGYRDVDFFTGKFEGWENGAFKRT